MQLVFWLLRLTALLSDYCIDEDTVCVPYTCPLVIGASTSLDSACTSCKEEKGHFDIAGCHIRNLYAQKQAQKY